jgi:hypothetical protein
MGGFIGQRMDAKYVFIAMSMLCGTAALIGIPFLRETYAPVIRSRLAKKTSDLEKPPQTLMTKDESIWKTLWLNLSRPGILLTHSFICFIFSLYLAMRVFAVFNSAIRMLTILQDSRHRCHHVHNVFRHFLSCLPLLPQR